MMKIKNILGVLFLSALTVACSDDTMDRINKNNQYPESSQVDAASQLTDAEVATVYSTINGGYAWYISSYTEQLFGTNNNQLKNAELRNINETAASTTFSNQWDATYLNLMNIYQMMAKCSDGGRNAGQTDIFAMGETLAALNWGILTDLHGDIPCSEALNAEISAPKLDKQEDVYQLIFQFLDDAIVNFTDAIQNNQNNSGSQDFLFSGRNKLSQWRGLAHALKARYLLHELGRATDQNAQMNSIIAEANAAIADGFDGATLDMFDGNSQINSWSAYWNSRDYIASSTTVDNLMLEREDPRRPIYHYDIYYNFYGPDYFKPSDKICTPGNPTQAQDMNQSFNAPEWLSNGCMTAVGSHLFSKSELYFILAEMKVRLNQDAKEDFNTAVRASMEDYATSSGEDISDDDIATYLSNIEAKYEAYPLSEILIQKYISQTRDEQIETFNDIRRVNYMDGNEGNNWWAYPVAMTNPNNKTQAGANRLPLRLPYGSSDVISNPNVKAAFGTGNDAGMYIFTENVWWAGGSR